MIQHTFGMPYLSKAVNRFIHTIYYFSRNTTTYRLVTSSYATATPIVVTDFWSRLEIASQVWSTHCCRTKRQWSLYVLLISCSLSNYSAYYDRAQDLTSSFWLKELSKTKRWMEHEVTMYIDKVSANDRVRRSHRLDRCLLFEVGSVLTEKG